METQSFGRVSGDSPETLRKMCVSTKLPHQGISLNDGILRSVGIERYLAQCIFLL